MLYKALAALVLSLLFCAVGAAQTIYEPVVSQYRAGDRYFYYGGSDARVIERAQRQLSCFQDSSRYTREGKPGVGLLHRGLIGEPYQYTYSDCKPYVNAVVYGYTSVDARNDAYANVPRFFRMADLHASAVVAPDGVGFVVPAQAPGTIDIRAYRRAVPPATRPSTEPSTQPKPVLIFPKKMLGPKPEPAKIVTDVR